MDYECDPGPPPVIRIGLADRHGLMRNALASMLERESGFELVAVAATWQELLDLIETRPIDVLLLDHGIVKGSLTESLRGLLARDPAPGVVLLALNAPRPLRVLALTAGADSCLLKDSPPGAIVAAIKSAVPGADADRRPAERP